MSTHDKRAAAIERGATRYTVDANGCWISTYSTTARGYAQVGYSDTGKTVTLLAHRAAYEYAFGPIPDGLTIDHVWSRGCRSKRCVRPDHLEAVGRMENHTRWVETLDNRCHEGHLLTPENTIIRTNGRRCRICTNDKARARYHSRKE